MNEYLFRMKNLKQYIYFLPALIFSFLNIGCSDDFKIVAGGDNYSIIKGDKVEVHLTVNLDNSGNERYRTRDNSNDGIHNPDYSNPTIGGGTLATTLIYQLYDDNGNPVALPNPDSESNIIGLHQVRVEKRQFPYSDIVFTVDNNREYTMIFWAQSGEEDNANKNYRTKGDWYYDTEDLKNILVKYDSQNERGQGQLNNTDSRDAFCAKIKFVGGMPLPEITLKRVVSQVNVGFSETLWEKLQKSNIDIRNSSMWIANVGRRFNLFENKVELFESSQESEEDISTGAGADEISEGGITWPFTMGAYTINTIPAYMKYPGTTHDSDTEEEAPATKLKVGEQEYIWVSMCYILAPGETQVDWEDDVSVATDLGSTVDVINMQFYDKNGIAYSLPLTEMTAIPVKRNYRTNILVDDLFNTTVSIDTHIGTDYYDDFGFDSNGIFDGEITPGLTYVELDGNSHWSGYNNGFAFYVSSLQGLKWLADRSNGLDFKERDVPAWMIQKEGWQDLSKQEMLKAYEEKIFNILFSKKRALLYAGNDKSYAGRNEVGYRMPITFDDCIIYLTNDLDFNDDPDIQNDWHGFSSNMSYGGANGNVRAWEMKINPDGTYSYTSTQTNYYHGFKGVFDGQGYTIYNMKVNNLNDFYEYSEMDGKTYGPRKLHNAGFICSAADYASVKNLRLYNAEIRGDYNIGGFIGYMNGDQTLKMENCRFVNGTVIGEEAQRLSPSDDANTGGIGGSIQCNIDVSKCQVVNSSVISSFIGGAFMGITGGGKTKKYSDCQVYNTNVILTELNSFGANWGSVFRTSWSIGTTHESSFFFGTSVDNAVLNTDTGDSSINAFYGIKYSPKTQDYGRSQSANEGAFGRSTVANVPLELFPDILTKYAQMITIDSHITGKARRGIDNENYGLKIDISGQPKTQTGKLVANNSSNEGNNLSRNDASDADPVWYFTLTGTRYESLPLQGQTLLEDKYSRQHVLLVSPNGLDNVKGVYVCAPDIDYAVSERHILVKDIIIAGEPSIDYGLYLDNVKEMTIDHVAVYDVRNAFGDKNVPMGATFSANECDFRGITNIGENYGSVTFKGSAFNKGSGNTGNIIGRMYANSTITFEDCVFRVDYRIVVENKDAVLEFKNCICGPPYNQQNLTPQNFWKYMDSTSNHPFLGKVRFNDNPKEYTYEELLEFRPK